MKPDEEATLPGHKGFAKNVGRVHRSAEIGALIMRGQYQEFKGTGDFREINM